MVIYYRMITIKIGNSYSVISPLTPNLLVLLRETIYYETESYNQFTNTFTKLQRPLVDKKGIFLTGLLPFVKKLLKEHKFDYDIIDERIMPTFIPAMQNVDLGFKPREIQSQATAAALIHKRGVIEAATGAGKSNIIAMIIKTFGVKTLVVVPSLELKRQISETLESIFGDLVGDTIKVANIQSLDAKDSSSFDCIILDEAHHAFADTYQELNKKAWTKSFYRISLTATPFRSKEGENMRLIGLVGQVIYRADYKTCVDLGYIVPVEAYAYQVPPKETKAKTYAGVYKDLVVNNEARNHIIAETLLQLYSDGINALCLVREVAHGKILQEMTSLPFASGEDDDSKRLIKRFSNGHGCLIATIGICGEGVDSRAAEYVIIAGLGKAKTQLMQAIGRGVRAFGDKQSCKVIIFEDTSHKYTKSHYKEQCEIIKDIYGVDITII